MDSQWQQATAYLHPRFKTDAFKADLIEAIAESKLFEISTYLQKTNAPVKVDGLLASCLLLLIDRPQSVNALVQHWMKLRPLNLVTFEPTTEAEAFALMKDRLTELEHLGFILLEA
jgi:hypothetical protein